jgi:hypothetical protein
MAALISFLAEFVGSVEALQLDWRLYALLLDLKRSSPEERWSGVIRPCLSLALAKENVFFDEERHHLFGLLSQYCDIVFGHALAEGSPRRDIVLLKWLVMLDRLANDESPIYFPLVDSLLYGDDQWLPDRQQWEDLSPVYSPGCLSLDEIPVEPLDVKSRLDEIDEMIAGFLRGVIDDEQSDFFSLLLGWILCPKTLGCLGSFDWNHPPLEGSVVARTFELWRMLLLLQKIVYRDRQPFPQMEVVNNLEILKWACLLHDVVTGEFTPDLEDAGSDGWLTFLGVDCPV